MKLATIDVYNNSADAMALKFRNIGARVDDVKRALELAGNSSDAKVVEIGCGDGRDAKIIVPLVKSYIGFDIAPRFIEIAKNYVPEANFRIGDAVTYVYPQELDIVFAFASLLHLQRADMQSVCNRVALALRPGGIFYISLKWASSYRKRLKKDEFGDQTIQL